MSDSYPKQSAALPPAVSTAPSQKDRTAEILDPSRPVFSELQNKVGYLAAEFYDVRYLDETTCFLRLKITNHPEPNWRFSTTRLVWNFKAPAADDSSKKLRDDVGTSHGAPRVIGLIPECSYWAMTSESQQHAVTLGGSVPVTAGAVSVSVPVGTVKDKSSKTVEYGLKIFGTSRGKPIKNQCIWTLQENQSTTSGLPQEYHLAVLLEHDGPFETSFSVDAELRRRHRPWRSHLSSHRQYSQEDARLVDIKQSTAWRRYEARKVIADELEEHERDDLSKGTIVSENKPGVPRSPSQEPQTSEKPLAPQDNNSTVPVDQPTDLLGEVNETNMLLGRVVPRIYDPSPSPEPSIAEQRKPNLSLSMPFGLGEGTPFNDCIDIGGFPETQTITSIKELRISHGWLFDGVEVVYDTLDGEKVANHLGNHKANETLTLESDEYIIGASGKVGMPGYFKDQPYLNSVHFVLANLSTGAIRIAGPYGAGAPNDICYEGNPFVVSGPIIAFAGKQNSPVSDSDLPDAITLSFIKAD